MWLENELHATCKIAGACHVTCSYTNEWSRYIWTCVDTLWQGEGVMYYNLWANGRRMIVMSHDRARGWNLYTCEVKQFFTCTISVLREWAWLENNSQRTLWTDRCNQLINSNVEWRSRQRNGWRWRGTNVLNPKSRKVLTGPVIWWEGVYNYKITWTRVNPVHMWR